MRSIKETTEFNNNTIKKFNYVSIFMLIYLSSSFYALSLKGTINLGLLLTTSVVTFFLSSKSKNMNKHSLFLLLIVLLGSAFTMLVNQEGIYHNMIFWIVLFSAFMIHISIDIRDFVIVYTRLLYFLCIYSLITFSILLSAPGILNYFPTVTNEAGLTVSNLIFSVVHDSSYINSNFGFFWEPGAYQTFINLALFFQIFVLKDLNIRRILVFLIAIFTTFSSTGYLAALMIMIIFIIMKRSIVKEEIFKRKKLIATFILLLVVGIFIFNLLPGIIQFKVFGKLESIFNTGLVNSSSSYESTTARIDAIKIPLENWMSNPFFGVGFTNLYNYTIDGRANFLTATPLNWFGLFGFSLGVILNYCIWRWTKLINKNLIIRILIFLFLIFITLSEFYNRNAFYLAFIMYGASIKPKLLKK